MAFLRARIQYEAEFVKIFFGDLSPYPFPWVFVKGRGYK
jgi:hypothetical protein